MRHYDFPGLPIPPRGWRDLDGYWVRCRRYKRIMRKRNNK